jgi:hypothetical protein
VTAAPPRVFREHVVTATLPRPADMEVTVRPTPAVVTVAWPVVGVTQDRPPPAPSVIPPAAPRQVSWRLPLPGGHPLRSTWVPPPRRR